MKEVIERLINGLEGFCDAPTTPRQYHALKTAIADCRDMLAEMKKTKAKKPE